MLREMQDMGYARIDSWGNLDLVALRTQSYAAIMANKRSECKRVADRLQCSFADGSSLLSVHRPTLPALKPLLANETLAAVLRGYLGGDVRYDGHVVLHLSQKT